MSSTKTAGFVSSYTVQQLSSHLLVHLPIRILCNHLKFKLAGSRPATISTLVQQPMREPAFATEPIISIEPDE
jgi:hypothetical protein